MSCMAGFFAGGGRSYMAKFLADDRRWWLQIHDDEFEKDVGIVRFLLFLLNVKIMEIYLL